MAKFHSTAAHPNNTFVLVDGLWKSATGEWYGWDDSKMYRCDAKPVPNYGPQDHSACHNGSDDSPRRWKLFPDYAHED